MNDTVEKRSKGVSQALGMFYRPSGVREFRCDEVDFLIGHAEGFNAGGLIGTEKNGIFLVCLTDKRVVFTEYMRQESCHCGHAGHQRAVELEMERITNLKKDALESFVSTRGSAYNPFADRRRRKKALKGDMNVRKNFRAESFSAGKWLTVSDKRTIVHDWEKLLIARIYGGCHYARSRFTKKLYDLLAGPYGHIAHYDKDGFYEAQLFRRPIFYDNLKMVAEQRTMYNMTLVGQSHSICEDLLQAMSLVARAYEGKHCID